MLSLNSRTMLVVYRACIVRWKHARYELRRNSTMGDKSPKEWIDAQSTIDSRLDLRGLTDVHAYCLACVGDEMVNCFILSCSLQSRGGDEFCSQND